MSNISSGKQVLECDSDVVALLQRGREAQRLIDASFDDLRVPDSTWDEFQGAIEQALNSLGFDVDEIEVTSIVTHRTLSDIERRVHPLGLMAYALGVIDGMNLVMQHLGGYESRDGGNALSRH